MGQIIRHSKANKPRMYPYNSDVAPSDMDRVQSFSGGGNQPFEMLYEWGREEKMAVDMGILESTVTSTQLESGSMDTYLKLANLSSVPVGGLDLDDFSNAKIDIITVGKDDYEGNLEQTLWLPKLSLNSITVSVADAEAKVERSYELSGDILRRLRGDNKYFIYKRDEVESGYSEDPYDITLTDPIPVVDPNHAGIYIMRLLRIRSGVTSELVLTTDYTYTNLTHVLQVLEATSGDIYKIYYTSDSWGTAGDPTSLNDADDYFLDADSVTVTLQSGTGTEVEMDLLTSLNIVAALNRMSEAVIGSDEKILKEVESKTTTVTLGGRVKNSTIEEVLMGQAGSDWGIIDAQLFKDDITVRLKVYEDETKTTFKIGYKSTNLFMTSTTQDEGGANEFLSENVTLQSDNLLISDNESDIDA
jgi:hypothetical protein